MAQRTLSNDTRNSNHNISTLADCISHCWTHSVSWVFFFFLARWRYFRQRGGIAWIILPGTLNFHCKTIVSLGNTLILHFIRHTWEPPQSRHRLRRRLCWQMLAPPHSLQTLRTRLCGQMLDPPHSLQTARSRLCWHISDPPQSLHLNNSTACGCYLLVALRKQVAHLTTWSVRACWPHTYLQAKALC